MATVLKYLLASATTLATTALNSLANNALVVCTAFDNTIGQTGDGYTEADLELVVTFGTNPTAGTSVVVWLLGAPDGTNYEDGGTGLTPTRLPDAVFSLTVSTAAQRLNRRIKLPAGKLTPLLKNDGTGQSFAASANTLKIRPYTPEGV